MANVRFGVCKLTLGEGRFVKSHIIPQALTESVWRGSPLTQEGRGDRRSVRRWSSWYDSRLVTEGGEELLSKYDTWGIDFLRKHRLIWSSWVPTFQLEDPNHYVLGDTGWGVRKILNVEGDHLRLFLLSLLWRAAATTLFEFDWIALGESELERLRRMILEGEAAPYTFLPITLIQLSTLGFPHNQSGGRSVKNVPIHDEVSGAFLEGQYREVEFFRLYFDGLAVHFHINEEPKYVQDNHVFVGQAADLLVSTVTYEVSAQRQFLDDAISRTPTVISPPMQT